LFFTDFEKSVEGVWAARVMEVCNREKREGSFQYQKIKKIVG
jgi:hypothetical protein